MDSTGTLRRCRHSSQVSLLLPSPVRSDGAKQTKSRHFHPSCIYSSRQVPKLQCFGHVLRRFPHAAQVDRVFRVSACTPKSVCSSNPPLLCPADSCLKEQSPSSMSGPDKWSPAQCAVSAVFVVVQFRVGWFSFELRTRLWDLSPARPLVRLGHHLFRRALYRCMCAELAQCANTCLSRRQDSKNPHRIQVVAVGDGREEEIAAAACSIQFVKIASAADLRRLLTAFPAEPS